MPLTAYAAAMSDTDDFVARCLEKHTAKIDMTTVAGVSACTPLYLFSAALYADHPEILAGTEPLFELINGIDGAEVHTLTRGNGTGPTIPQAQFFLGGVRINGLCFVLC